MAHPAWGSGLMMGGGAQGTPVGPAGGGKSLRKRSVLKKCSGEDAGKQGSPGPHLSRSEVSEGKNKS